MGGLLYKAWSLEIQVGIILWILMGALEFLTGKMRMMLQCLVDWVLDSPNSYPMLLTEQMVQRGA